MNISSFYLVVESSNLPISEGNHTPRIDVVIKSKLVMIVNYQCLANDKIVSAT